MEYAIIYRPGPAWIPGRLPDQQDLNAHISYLQALRAQRKLIQAGPFMSDNSEVTVIEVGSEAEARSIVAADPAVIRGVLHAELTPWSIVFGLHADRYYPTKLK
jgi:uncharacterized protein YciI